VKSNVAQAVMNFSIHDFILLHEILEQLIKGDARYFNKSLMQILASIMTVQQASTVTWNPKTNV
jgi:hypothetical protein